MKRFIQWCALSHQHALAEAADDGPWVLFDEAQAEIERLMRECDRLRAALTRIASATQHAESYDNCVVCRASEIAREALGEGK